MSRHRGPGRGRTPLRVGTAGWAIPRAHAESFPQDGSGLSRYAARFSAAEINSSFHRPHRPSTYGRWAAAVPDGFHFSVKLPKAITHERRLVGVEAELDAFLAEIGELGDRLGPLLVQLPPSLTFETAVADAFFRFFADRTAAPVACEPRHPSWFTSEANDLLAACRVARVAADPARVPDAAEPGGWPGLSYWRLHGSPRMYRSAYERPYLAAMAARIAARPEGAWCIFDNTASGAAAGNALDLACLLDRRT